MAVWTNSDQKPAGVGVFVFTVQADVSSLCMRCASDSECGSLSLHSHWPPKLVRAFPFRIRESPKNLSALAPPPSSWSPPGPDLSRRPSSPSHRLNRQSSFRDRTYEPSSGPPPLLLFAPSPSSVHHRTRHKSPLSKHLWQTSLHVNWTARDFSVLLLLFCIFCIFFEW